MIRSDTTDDYELDLSLDEYPKQFFKPIHFEARTAWPLRRTSSRKR